MNDKRHPFSLTLGAGPYRYVGNCDLGAAKAKGSYDHLPRLDGGMGTCAHCGMPILDIYIVLTGDGKKFGVGCDCIEKVYAEGDVKGMTELERDKRRIARDKRENRELAKREAMKDEYAAALVILKSLPHPNEYFATQGKTAADYYTYISRNSKNMKQAIEAAKQGVKS